MNSRSEEIELAEKELANKYLELVTEGGDIAQEVQDLLLILRDPDLAKLVDWEQELNNLARKKHNYETEYTEIQSQQMQQLGELAKKLKTGQAVPVLETKDVVEKFIESRKHSITPATLKTYGQILGTFSRKHHYLPTTPEPIESYLASKPTATSRQLYFSVLSELYKFANKRLEIPQVMEAISRPKAKRKEADYLNLDQVKALLATISNDRQRGLIYLYLGLGLRRAEATRINIEDISQDKIRLHGKERGEWFPLLPEVREALEKIATGRNGNEPLFTSQRRGRLSPDMAAVEIRRSFNRAGITNLKLSPHTLRHTFATLAVSAGCDRDSVGQLLRHRNENMSDTYIHVGIERRLELLREKLEIYSPLRLVAGKNIPINTT